jgi:hypothetical protein
MPFCPEAGNSKNDCNEIKTERKNIKGNLFLLAAFDINAGFALFFILSRCCIILNSGSYFISK